MHTLDLNPKHETVSSQGLPSPKNRLTSVIIAVAAFMALPACERAKSTAAKTPTPTPSITQTYEDLAKAKGLTILTAEGKTLHQIVLGIQKIIEPKNVDMAVDTISIQRKTGYIILPDSQGAQRIPLAAYNLSITGPVTFAIVMPEDLNSQQRINSAFHTQIILPEELNNPKLFGFKSHLSNIGADTITASSMHEETLKHGATKLTISLGQATDSPSLISFLRENLPPTTFSGKFVRTGDLHTDIASRISGQENPILGKYLEKRQPDMHAGNDFTITPPTFLTQEKGQSSLVLYFGNSEDRENFKTDFIGVKKKD